MSPFQTLVARLQLFSFFSFIQRHAFCRYAVQLWEPCSCTIRRICCWRPRRNSHYTTTPEPFRYFNFLFMLKQSKFFLLHACGHAITTGVRGPCAQTGYLQPIGCINCARYASLRTMGNAFHNFLQD